MFVRSFHLMSLALALAACFTVQLAAAADPDTPRRPNVLFLAIDDLNDWTGFLGGHPDSRTPHLDQLAARGTVFTRAYCSAPSCNPSRASLLTGRHPATTGVYTNSQAFRSVLPDVVTLPQHFMQHGYQVLGGGKIYHGSFPDKQSWHSYFNRPRDPLPKQRPVNGIQGTAHFDWGPVAVSDAEMSDTQVVNWAIEQLQAEHSKPLFLAVGLVRPHLPWYAPQEYFDQFPLEKVQLPKVLAGDLDDVPEFGIQRMARLTDHRKVTQTDNWKKAVQGYLASVAFADRQAGRLLDALAKSPLADNTVIVMWGDHGWHLGEKQHWRKFALWEEATRVPLVILAPGVTKAGARCERTVSLLDLYPTLCELCGLPARDDVQGQSLRPLLANADAAWDRPVVTTYTHNNHAVRSEQYRYIRYQEGSEELYDHNTDPMEFKNLATDPAFERVKQELAKWLPKQNAPDAPKSR